MSPYLFAGKSFFAKHVDKSFFVRYCEKYFARPTITERIWRKIENGEHLQLTAPRRVGKTSILKHMVRQPRKGYRVKYIIVQSVDQENEFYKLLFNLSLIHI